MASSSNDAPGTTEGRDHRLSQQSQPVTVTRSMSRRSSLALSNPTVPGPSSVHTAKSSLPSARRIGSTPSSTSTLNPRTRSSTSLATRSSTLTAKSAATTLSTSRARRVLSETSAHQPTFSSSSSSASLNNHNNVATGIRRSTSSSIASIRSPPRQGVRRYSRAEAGGLTGFGVVKAGPRVVSPVKLEREPATTANRIGESSTSMRPGGGGGNVNDPYSTSFQRPTFAFETSSTSSTSTKPLPPVAPRGSFAIRGDTKTSDDEDELYLQSPRKIFNPLSSPSKFSPSKNASPFRSTSPTKRYQGGGDENMDLDPTVTIPIRPSSPIRGALSPRTLIGGNVAAQTLRRTKPSRKIEEVDSSSEEEDDELDFLSPRKKAKLPSSTTNTAERLPRSAPSTVTRNTGYGSRIAARTRTSTGTTSARTIDRSQLLRSPPPKKPVSVLPKPSTDGSATRPLLSSAPMQRTAGRTFALPSSLPPVPPIPSSSQSSLPAPALSSRPSLYSRPAPLQSRPSASTSSVSQAPPAPISRLPRRISNELSTSAPLPPPPAPSAQLLARSTSPTGTDPSLSLMSIDESRETSFSQDQGGAGDISTMSTTSVRSEDTAKRLANLQNMLSRLQMPRKSVGGTISRRTSIESANSSILEGDESELGGGGGDALISSARQRGPSVSRLPSARPRGGIVDTSSTSSSFRGSRSISRPPSSTSTTSAGPSARRISSSFLPSQSFDLSCSSSINPSELSMLDNDEASRTETFSESTIKVPQTKSVLNGVVAFVDVRTGEGDDSGMIFCDMLKGMGARVTSRPSSLTTHIVYKSGKPSTLQFVRSCVRRPKVVGIAWVVRCAELGQKVDEKPFIVVEEKKEVDQENSLFAVGAGKTIPAQKRRRSMEPKALAALNSSVNSANLASSNPALKASIAASLERARLRSLQFAPKVGSPLAKRVFVVPDVEDDHEEMDADE
ncbi:BRCT domain-containing protein [Sporobolomyces salmoneus]|uniref:BRCT domain-containing protein n=1 Tax=Sporobolomyces salmoneus TaxID=183962 RepID=UPI003174C237